MFEENRYINGGLYSIHVRSLDNFLLEISIKKYHAMNLISKNQENKWQKMICLGLITSVLVLITNSSSATSTRREDEEGRRAF